MNILVIEDDPDWHELYPRLLKKYGTVQLAVSLAEAQALFDTTPDICLVVVDGCVEGKAYDTGPIVRYIRTAGYTGPIIGATGSTELAPQMMADGCTSVGMKIDVVPLIKTYEDTHGPLAAT